MSQDEQFIVKKMALRWDPYGHRKLIDNRTWSGGTHISTDESLLHMNYYFYSFSSGLYQDDETGMYDLELECMYNEIILSFVDIYSDGWNRDNTSSQLEDYLERRHGRYNIMVIVYCNIDLYPCM